MNADYYFHNIQEFRPMTIEHERILATAAKCGDKAAKDELIQNNQGLVIRMARRYWGMAGRNLELLDLVQFGNIGLLHAIRKFEPERGHRFSTYAVYWIRAYIRRYTMQGSTQLTCSTRHLEYCSTVRSERAGGNPSTILTDAQRALVHETLNTRFVSLDMDAGAESDATIGDLIGETIDIEGAADASILNDYVSKLPAKQRTALYLRFTENLTNKQVGERMGMTYEGARLIVEQAISSLRAYLKVSTYESMR